MNKSCKVRGRGNLISWENKEGIEGQVGQAHLQEVTLSKKRVVR